MGAGLAYVFESNRSDNYTTRYIQRLVKVAARRAGIDRHVTPHRLRASVATILLDAGMPLDQVQKFLRHKRITTTQIYAETSLHGMSENYVRALGAERGSAQLCDLPIGGQFVQSLRLWLENRRGSHLRCRIHCRSRHETGYLPVYGCDQPHSGTSIRIVWGCATLDGSAVAAYSISVDVRLRGYCPCLGCISFSGGASEYAVRSANDFQRKSW